MLRTLAAGKLRGSWAAACADEVPSALWQAGACPGAASCRAGNRAAPSTQGPAHLSNAARCSGQECWRHVRCCFACRLGRCQGGHHRHALTLIFQSELANVKRARHPNLFFPQLAVVYILSLCLLGFRKIRDAGHAIQHMLAKMLLESLYVWQHESTLCMLPNGAFCSDGGGLLYRQAHDMVREVCAGACGERPCCTGGPAAAVCAAPTSSFEH